MGNEKAGRNSLGLYSSKNRSMVAVRRGPIPHGGNLSSGFLGCSPSNRRQVFELQAARREQPIHPTTRRRACVPRLLPPELLRRSGCVNKSGAIGEVCTHSEATQTEPTFCRLDLGADLNFIVSNIRRKGKIETKSAPFVRLRVIDPGVAKASAFLHNISEADTERQAPFPSSCSRTSL